VFSDSITPKCWKELDAALWLHSESADPRQLGFRPFIAYRGLPETYPDLRTGIQRLDSSGNSWSVEELKFRERRVIETFGVYAGEHLPRDPTDWDTLLLGQHHRLPTRLLDWTASPYVALFFATEDPRQDSQNGLIWCVRRHDTNEALPSRVRSVLKTQKGQMFTLATLREHFRKGLIDLDKEPDPALLWFEPPSLSPRIVNQYAFFSVMTHVENRHCEWLAKLPKCYWRVSVPAALKSEVRRRLQVMNITERMIYTGLEGIARWIRAYYSP
jgi:hypothetical protein